MHRRLSRPRTKVYDSCYSMNEAYYKSTLDSLDMKQGRRVSSSPAPVETREPSQPKRIAETRGRPASVSDMDAIIKQATTKAEQEAEDDALAETLKRIRIARGSSTMSTEPHESFETAFNHRREEVKKRFSEKMLDAVGINGLTEEDTIGQVIAKRRSARMIREAEEAVLPTKWTALSALANTEQAEVSAAGAAAEARAMRTRARLADLEREMEDVESRSVARQRRAAALRSMLSEQEMSSSSSSAMAASSSIKKMTVTSTTTTTKSSY